MEYNAIWKQVKVSKFIPYHSQPLIHRTIPQVNHNINAHLHLPSASMLHSKVNCIKLIAIVNGGNKGPLETIYINWEPVIPPQEEDEDLIEWVQNIDYFESGVMEYMADELQHIPCHLACNVKVHDYTLVDVHDMFAFVGKAHLKGSSHEDEKYKTLIGMFWWLNYFPVSLGMASAEEACWHLLCPCKTSTLGHRKHTPKYHCSMA